MYLYKLYHNGEEVLYSKEEVRVTCRDLSEHLVHYNNKVYKIGVPVLEGLKCVYIITDDVVNDKDVYRMLKDCIIKQIRVKLSNAKAALEEWERYNVEQ